MKIYRSVKSYDKLLPLGGKSVKFPQQEVTVLQRLIINLLIITLLFLYVYIDGIETSPTCFSWTGPIPSTCVMFSWHTLLAPTELDACGHEL